MFTVPVEAGPGGKRGGEAGDAAMGLELVEAEAAFEGGGGGGVVQELAGIGGDGVIARRIQLTAKATFWDRVQLLWENTVDSEGLVPATAAVPRLMKASVLVRKTPPPLSHLMAYTMFNPRELIFMMASWEGLITPVVASNVESEMRV